MNEESTALQFDIIYGEESHSIDSNTLTTSILNFSNFLQELNNELNPGTKLDMRIEAFAPGSFKVQSSLSTRKEKEGSMLEPDEKSKEVIATAKEIVELKKHLGGKKPSSVSEVNENGEVKIANDKGDITFVKADTQKIVSSNKEADSYLTNTFKAIEEDESIEDFQVELESKPYFKIERSEFSSIKQSTINDDKTVDEEVKNQVELVIFKVVMDEGYKWEFLYAGGKISADIIDKSLFGEIDEGLKFGKGDRLIGDLRIIKEFNKSLQAFEIKNYQVIKFYEKKDRPTQLRLSDTNS